MKHFKNSAYISLLVFLLHIPLSALANEMEHLNDAQNAFNTGNYALSYTLWQIEAQQGDSDAQVFVGLSHANGWGVSKDLKQASIWYQKAADNNNPSGQLLLALYYLLEDDGNRAAGLTWLTRAADGGDSQAKTFLEKGYAKGWFTDITPTNLTGTYDRSPISHIALADTMGQ